MQQILDIATTVFLGLGCLLALTGTVGILRMPDFYTRLHPAGKTDSLAQVLIMIALLMQVGRYETLIENASSRLVMITLFILLTSPVATHSITKAAYLHGLQPWTRPSGNSQLPTPNSR